MPTIEIYGSIGADGVSTDRVSQQLRSTSGEELTIRIDSMGGSVFHSIGIYNRLKDHPAKKTVIVDAAALSGAVVVAMAGNQILMNEGAVMMVHDPIASADFSTAEELRGQADMMDKLRAQIVGIMARRTRNTEKKVSAMMAAETWLDAREAVAAGFADRVIVGVQAASRIAAQVTSAIPEKYRVLLFGGAPPLGKGGTGTAAAAFSAAVQRGVAAGLPRHQAIAAVVKSSPELHRRYLIEANQGRPAVVRQLRRGV